MVGTVLFLAANTASAGECEREVSSLEFASLLIRHAPNDDPMQRAQAALACVTEPLTAPDASLFHQAAARSSWRAGARTEAISSAAAVLAARPGYAPPADLVELYALAQQFQVGAAIKVPAGSIIDGVPGGEAHVGRVAVVQVPSEGKFQTLYLHPYGELLSPATTATRAAVDRGLRATATSPQRSPRPKQTLLAIGGATLAAAATMWVVTAAQHAAFNDFDNPDINSVRDLEAVGTAANVSATVALGTTAIGGSFLAAGLLRVEWK